ncbi:DUF4595 domain-containing protein [Prevotella intermedia]|uniref:DUF4595 domain-containing protein n=1 Tax=Prevotella intermedia TaxID=28131 RepID=UPI000BE710D8|nr:DUF4595 domain-containing protein [Prevotella intermedia]PDP67768.1 hypothetical protein CLI70_09505 [Prevotella intermedia]
MKKLSNFVWLLAIALTTTFALTACSDSKNDEPDAEKGKVKVNPAKVFVNGMPKIMDGYVFTKDAQGRVSSIVNKKEKEEIKFEYRSDVLDTTEEPNVVMTVNDDGDKTVYSLFLNKDGFVKYCVEYEYGKNDIPKSKTWNLKYNSDGRLVEAVQTQGGYQTTSTIKYENGDATESSTVSQKEGKETDHYRIFYTSSKVTSPIVNKGCIMSFDVALGVDLDDLGNAYYAGMLGKATKHLPIYNLNGDNERTSFEWTINKGGFPTKVVVKDEDGKGESNIVW